MAERNCKKCFHYNACKEVASHNGYANINYTESQCKNFIPTADIVKVKHGYWIKGKRTGINVPQYTCSKCGKWEDAEFPYCNCGAKMDGTTKEEVERSE